MWRKRSVTVAGGVAADVMVEHGPGTNPDPIIRSTGFERVADFGVGPPLAIEWPQPLAVSTEVVIDGVEYSAGPGSRVAGQFHITLTPRAAAPAPQAEPARAPASATKTKGK